MAMIDLRDGSGAVARCACDVQTLTRLNGDSLFRLSTQSDKPISVFDAGEATPQFSFISARRSN